MQHSLDDQIWSKILGYQKQFLEFVLKDLKTVCEPVSALYQTG